MTQVRSRETTLLNIIRKIEPTFDAERRVQVEYPMRGRVFTANPATRGAYGPDLDHAIGDGRGDGFALYTDDGKKLVYA